jgi:hypothetical protein
MPFFVQGNYNFFSRITGGDWSTLSEWVFFTVCVEKNTTVLVVNNTVEKNKSLSYKK